MITILNSNLVFLDLKNLLFGEDARRKVICSVSSRRINMETLIYCDVVSFELLLGTKY